MFHSWSLTVNQHRIIQSWTYLILKFYDCFIKTFFNHIYKHIVKSPLARAWFCWFLCLSSTSKLVIALLFLALPDTQLTFFCLEMFLDYNQHFPNKQYLSVSWVALIFFAVHFNHITEKTQTFKNYLGAARVALIDQLQVWSGKPILFSNDCLSLSHSFSLSPPPINWDAKTKEQPHRQKPKESYQEEY